MKTLPSRSFLTKTLMVLLGAAAPAAAAITDIHVMNIDEHQATIVWTTDLPAASFVDWGVTINYGNRTPTLPAATQHSQTLTGLPPGTVHHFRVTAGNSVSSDRTFTTHSPHDGDFAAPGCDLPNAAFCEDFDLRHPGGRGGDLDERKWSFSRIFSHRTFSVHQVNGFLPTDAMQCRTQLLGVVPPNDSFFCDEHGLESMHWMEALNDGADGGGYGQNSLRPRQPFDFAGRTGKVVFNVDGRTNGAGWWLEFFLTDEPLSNPHGGNTETFNRPRNGFGISFQNSCGRQGERVGPGGSIDIFRNYGVTTLREESPTTCVETKEDALNHFELRISQNRLEIWASDFSQDHQKTFPNFRRIAAFQGLNLPFTRGYIHFQHAQINAQITEVPSSHHTYHWDKIAFDGPVLPMDRGYSVEDALTPAATPGMINLGYMVMPNAGVQTCCRNGVDHSFDNVAPFTLRGVDLTNARDARLNLNVFWPPVGTASPALRYRWNGGAWRSYAREGYTERPDYQWYAHSIPLQLSDLRNGDNTLEFATDIRVDPAPVVIANIDLDVSVTAGAPSPTDFIAGIAVTNVGQNSAMISWTTAEPADSQVEYGPTTAYGSMTPAMGHLMSVHSQTLTGLAPNTLYHFRVHAFNAAGMRMTDDLAFRTTGAGGSTPGGLAGDVNGDGLVNITDLSLFLGLWNTSNASADFNADGNVGIADLSLLLGNWSPAAVSTQAFGAPAPGNRLAASLKMLPRARRSQAEPITVDVFLDSPQAVNAVQASLMYPADKLTLLSVDASASPFSIAAREESGNPGSVLLVRGNVKPLAGRLKIATLSFRADAPADMPNDGGAGHGHAPGAPAAGVYPVQFTRGSLALTASGAVNVLAKADGLDLSGRLASQTVLTPATNDGINDQTIFDADVSHIVIVDANGRKVFEAESLAGASLSWDGRDERGAMVASGLYIVKIRRADGSKDYRNILVVK